MQQNIQDQFSTGFIHQQQTLMFWRRLQLSMGCTILLTIIVNIIYKKLYVYNTTKLFMWVCICYFTGMVVVLSHVKYFTGGYQFAYMDVHQRDDRHYILNLLNKMKQNRSLYMCGAQSFINLYAYDFGYFFAVLISYNVLCVIHDDYRNFMKRVFKNRLILVFLSFMLVIYLIPFIFMLTPQDFNSDFYYSYAPMGINYSVYSSLQGSSKSAQLLLFCGFTHRPGSDILRIAQIVNMYTCPFLMLVVHSLILMQNRKKLKQLMVKQQYLNSKQRFILESGKIGIIVFSIQLIHFAKFVLSFVPGLNVYQFILVINFIFDCYPLMLLYFYVRYTRDKREKRPKEHSLISQQ